MMDNVLCGNIADLPKLSPNVIKIYVASTRDDFSYERQRLWEDTLPELQHHLLGFGLDVELIDIHQGVKLDHALDRHLFDQHLQLIKHCHKVSTGAFFLCLVGNKHGEVPLPSHIEEYEYKHFKEEAVQAGKDVKLLERWYYKDSNAIPPVYTLKPMTDEYPALSVGCYEYSETFNKDFEDWSKTHAALLDLLQHCAHVCYKEGRINQEHGHRQQRFFMSTVEEEIQQAMQVSVSMPIVVIRTLESMVWKDPEAHTYINLKSPGEVDVAAQQRQKTFKEIINSKMGEDNKVAFTVPWRKQGINPVKCDAHAEYLDAFHNAVVSKVLAMVEKQRQVKTPLPCNNIHQKYPDTPLQVYHEVQVHSKYCRRLLRKTRPRGFEELEDKLKKLIATHAKEEHNAILLHGPEGCGKTMLTSRLAQLSMEVLGKDSYLILRYAGLTAHCKSMYTLLHGICTQIEFILKKRKRRFKSKSFDELVDYFRRLMNMLSEREDNVIIVIDGVHNLRQNPRLENLMVNNDWLTEKLPPRVHLICSLLDRKKHIQTFNMLQGKLPETDSVFAIPTLKENHLHQILKDNFTPAKRKLTAGQEDKLIEACMTDDGCRPLHVKLCINQALQSKSYTEVTKNTFASSIEGAINCRFSMLEFKYGEELISIIVFYLCACYCGLSEMELIDLLSCNNRALLLVLKHLDFSEQTILLRFPYSVWWSIRTDFGSCLHFVYVENKKLLCWANAIVGQIAIQRYRPSIDSIKQAHTDIADLFGERWVGNKPMMIPEKNIEIIDTGNRIVCQQPLLYNETEYNYRKLNELWFQQLHTGNMGTFKDSTLCNFDYLLSKLHSTSVNSLLADFDMTLAHVLDADLALVQQSVSLGSKIMSTDSLQLAAELIGRIRQIKEFFPTHMDTLVQQCMEWCDSFTLPLLVPLSSWLDDPRDELVKTIRCPKAVNLICVTPNNQHLFCTTSDDTILMYHVASLSLIRKLIGPSAHISSMCISAHSRLYCSSVDASVHVWDITTGTLVHVIKEHKSAILCMALTGPCSDLVVTGSKDNSFKVICTRTYEVIHSISEHQDSVTCLSLTQGDVMLMTAASNNIIKVWLMEDMSLLNTIDTGRPSPISTMALSCDNTFLLIGCEDNTVFVKAFTTGTDIHALKGMNTKANKIIISEDSKHCVIAGNDGVVYTYNFRTKELVHAHLTQAVEFMEEEKQHPISSIEVSSDEHFIFSTCHQDIYVWSYYKAKLKGITPDKHTDIITCMAMSRDGKTGITGSRDNTVKLWNLEISDFMASWEGHVAQVTCVDITQEESFAVSGSEDTTVKVWSIIMGCVITDYREHRSSIIQVCTMHEPSRVISTEEDGCAKMWKAENGETLWSMDTNTSLCRLAPNLTYVLSGDPAEFLRIWLVSDGAYVGQKICHSDVISCVNFSHDSQFLVTGSTDNSLKVWEVSTAKLTQVLVEHDAYISCAEITHCNNHCVSGSYDKRLLVWNLTTGMVEQQLVGHTHSVTCVKITHDSTVAVSGSMDGTLRVWNVHQGSLITMFDMHSVVYNLFLTPNADRIMVHLENNPNVPLMCLHNSPAGGVKSQSDIEVHIATENAVLPVKPKPLTAHVPSTVYSLPKKRIDRQTSVSTIPEIIKLSPIRKAPLMVTVKAQEVNQEKRIARELSSIGSSVTNVKDKKAKRDKKKASTNSTLCVIF